MPDNNFARFSDLARFAGNPIAETLLLFPCPQRVLMVTDGSLDFGTGSFGLSEFVSIIQAAGHTVHTAHRNGVGPATIGGAFNFQTAATAVTTANYDQIWLFGHSTTPLSGLEQTRLASFMAAGGGVFATGDHSSIGAGMGANLPRVRKMRNWASVPMISPNRLDTVGDAGLDNITQFGDQSNAVPQRTYPVFFSNGGSDFVASTWAVHPVLRHTSGAIDVMPDHAHESECLAPTPVPEVFAGVQEWPSPAAGGSPIAPHIVSVSMSAGRFIVSGAPTASGTKPPVYPRSFGGISAYDGDAASVGRIVCDSTWHHFVNINLNGAGAGVDSAGNPFVGLYAAGAPTPEYLKIQTYFRNTVRWLAPRNRRRCWPVLQAALARFDPEVMEIALPHPHPCPWDPLQALGLAVEQALQRQWGPGTEIDVVQGLLDAADAPAPLAALLKPGADPRSQEASLMPTTLLRRAMLGHIVNLLAHKLPNEPKQLTELLRNDTERDRMAASFAVETVQATQKVFGDYLQRALKTTTAQAKAFL